MVERLLLEDLETSLARYVEKYGKEYKEILHKSKLLTDHMMANRYECNTHIDYTIPDGNPQAVKEYTAFIANECRIHGIHLNMDEDVEDWREALKISIASENCAFVLDAKMER